MTQEDRRHRRGHERRDDIGRVETGDDAIGAFRLKRQPHRVRLLYRQRLQVPGKAMLAGEGLDAIEQPLRRGRNHPVRDEDAKGRGGGVFQVCHLLYSIAFPEISQSLLAKNHVFLWRFCAFFTHGMRYTCCRNGGIGLLSAHQGYLRRKTQ